MKKLLLVALVAAMVAGTAEAGRRGCNPCKRQRCEVAEEVCRPAKRSCIKPGRCVENTFSKDCVEGEIPEFCYLVPAAQNYKKHTDVVTTITYECADLPCCAVRPTAEQVEQLRNDGAIPSTCN